jgi:hypothetical protein
LARSSMIAGVNWQLVALLTTTVDVGMVVGALARGDRMRAAVYLAFAILTWVVWLILLIRAVESDVPLWKRIVLRVGLRLMFLGIEILSPWYVSGMNQPNDSCTIFDFDLPGSRMRITWWKKEQE